MIPVNEVSHMNCPNCNAFCDDNHYFCSRCGTRLVAETPAKKGSHWVPVLILVILSILGTVLYFAAAGDPLSCFQVKDGALYFDQTLYTGSEELTVPEQISGSTVYSISDSCFADCDHITTVTLPDSVENIGSHAFEDCDSLRGIRLPESVTIIGAKAFAGCSSLEAVSIPASAAYIAPDAFEGCTDLRYVFYAGTLEDWLYLYGPYMDSGVEVYCGVGN